MNIYNTDLKTKKKYWPKFVKLMQNQFEHGGEKYKLGEDKEITDWVNELAPGKSGIDWFLQTIAKYLGRFKNFGREKDLLKIAVYCYIAWLKKGFHKKKKHDEDINKHKND